jgi:hypothetical protein
MHKERLLKAAEVTERAPFSMFDMVSFFFSSPGCGTSACSAGFCALDSWFIERGFRLSKESHAEKGGEQNREPIYTTRSGKRHANMVAVEKFFHLSGDDAEYLFGPDDPRTPKQQAKIIRKFVANGGR